MFLFARKIDNDAGFVFTIVGRTIGKIPLLMCLLLLLSSGVQQWVGQQSRNRTGAGIPRHKWVKVLILLIAACQREILTHHTFKFDLPNWRSQYYYMFADQVIALALSKLNTI